GSVYEFHPGYWGPTVGFYGGINYGFGYGGVGYVGGGWQGDHFRYNTAVTRVNVTNIHNTYIDKTVINKQVTRERTSFNGGPKGTKAEPTEEQRQAMNAEHINPTAAQEQHRQEASQNKAQFTSADHGKPGNLASNRPAGPRPEDQPRTQVPGTHIGTPKQEPPTTHVGTPKQGPPVTHIGTPEQRPPTHVGTPEQPPNTHIGTPKQEAHPHADAPRDHPEGRPPQANHPAPRHGEPKDPKLEQHKRKPGEGEAR
ncbi:MAG: hypothetical protein INR62_05785, partial [Rhodospirillales bacterium]|nr:hypothetical protein [Acetobacter sp.]